MAFGTPVGVDGLSNNYHGPKRRCTTDTDRDDFNARETYYFRLRWSREWSDMIVAYVSRMQKIPACDIDMAVRIRNQMAQPRDGILLEQESFELAHCGIRSRLGAQWWKGRL